ncbi:MAG: AAA family ATPase [Planctomycetes bacterium]|nr:AAA family ATPase [Planctomycetota bacterium]
MIAHRDDQVLSALKSDCNRLKAALEAAGGQFRGTSTLKCPFHEDRNASAGIHEQDGVWWFTCHSCDWNGGKGSGDVIAVAMKDHECDFKAALGHLDVGANGNGRHRGIKPKTKPTAAAVDAVQKFATDSAARLMADDDALDRLWRTRGIDAGTAAVLGLGVTGEPGKRYLTLPIADASGKFLAVKSHAFDGQKPKSLWNPAGTKSKQLFPVCLDGPGPVWLCPGELKAAAVIGVGLPAIGVTAGEGKGKDLPSCAITLLKDACRQVALPLDDDDTGAEWGDLILRQLVGAGIDVRIVDLGLDKSVGLKDVGDLITRELVENAREPDGVRETLLHAYTQSDPWARFTFGNIVTSAETWQPVTYIRTGLDRFDELAGGGLRTRGVHLLVGKPGMAKTTLAVQIAGNAALAGVPTGIVSLELARQDLSKLIVAQHTGIPRRELDSGQIDNGYQSVFDTFRHEHADAPLVIVDDDRWEGGLNRDKLAALVAEGVKRFGWRLVVLDYLGLLAPGDRDRGEFESDLLNSTSIKKLATRHDIALVVVAALRKAANYRKKSESDKITLDDVSGAGRLTYDCTSCWFVEADRQSGHAPSGTLKVHCLKSRFSGAASLGEIVQLCWAPYTGQVTDVGSDT